MSRADVFVRLLGFLKGRGRMLAAAALLGIWTTGANVGLLAVAAYLISLSALSPPLSYLIPAVFLVQFLGGSRAFSRYAERVISHDLTFGMLKEIRVWVYGRLRPLAPARLVQKRSGDLLSRLVSDVEQLQDLYLRVVSPIAVAVSVCAATGLALYVVYSPLVPLVLGALALGGIGVPLLAGWLEGRAAGDEPALRAELDARVVDCFWGSTELLASGRVADAARDVRGLSDKLESRQRRTALVGSLRGALDDLIAGLAVLAVLLISIPAVQAGELRGVYLALIALLVRGSFEAVRPLGEAMQSLGGVLAAGSRIFEISDEEPAVEDPVYPLPAPAGHRIELRGVGFRYASGEPRVLEDVSLSLKTGGKVAVVGPSGAGKSTLVGLLLRFWDAEEGEVLLDGRDLREYAQEDVRSRLTVAAQDDHIFGGTVRENLLLARPEASEEELGEALDLALLADLPGGLDCEVGESGARLSGGEARRLSVARALLR
ncbi:MAG: thiol reductant ABC exporter subunit CydC, partial [Rubrobacter sp.]|nr:thiol reductant ABC exporter subunit CydC [Rubrobacter sp.]